MKRNLPFYNSEKLRIIEFSPEEVTLPGTKEPDPGFRHPDRASIVAPLEVLLVLKTFRFDKIFYRFDHFNEKKTVQVYHIIQWTISEKSLQYRPRRTRLGLELCWETGTYRFHHQVVIYDRILLVSIFAFKIYPFTCSYWHR